MPLQSDRFNCDSSNMQNFRNVIVIGTSAGGIPALRSLVSQLPPDINAVVFVVLHLSVRSNAQVIAEMLQRHTSLTCNVATDGGVISRGHLYLAPPDRHMIIKRHKIIVHHGARENKYRPSIDVLFRSAAVNYGSRVIGVILTGLLDDGTSGMSALKRCGGICIVQDPAEADYSDMPQSVINHIEVDHKVRLSEIGDVLNGIFDKPVPPAVSIPGELLVENIITEKMTTSIKQLNEIGDRSDFTCPDCGGGLWALRNDPAHRYRCYTGHVYTEQSLYETQGLNLEESVWVSMRMLEERRNLLLLMATYAEKAGNDDLAFSNRNRADEMILHIKRLKVLLARLTEGMEQRVDTSVIKTD